MTNKHIAIIGGGPSGLTAAEALSHLGHSVTIYDAMPSVARKFLLAGKSGLNITHSEAYPRYLERFAPFTAQLQPALDHFTPTDIRAWAADLGIETFIGSSGRVFPTSTTNRMKASPLLRAWLKRLEAQGVQLLTRHRWIGFEDGTHIFTTPNGEKRIQCDAALLGFGGASWPRLGSDAGWVATLRAMGVKIADFQPANCGFDCNWSTVFRERYHGAPIKSVVATSACGSSSGEFVITRHGIEGSLIYAHTAALRDQLLQSGKASLELDLAPGRSLEKLTHDLGRQDKKISLSNRLRKAAGLEGAKSALLRELTPELATLPAPALAQRIKALALPVMRTRPIAEAISSAGGIDWSSIDQNYMVKTLPGIFVAGEMLNWEAPTGGYLLSGCFATGRYAAQSIHQWLQHSQQLNIKI